MSFPVFFRSFADRRFLAGNMIAISGIFLLVVFPRNSAWESMLLSFFVFLVLPIVFIRVILREPLSRFGFSWGSRSEIFNAGLIFGALLIFLFFLWGLLMGYPGESPLTVPGNIRTNFREFVWYATQSTILNGLSCLFFQGFLLSVWKKQFHLWSVVWVTGLFFIFLFIKNNFSLQPGFLLFIPWSLLASLVAYFSKSAFVAFVFFFFSGILAIVSVMLRL